MAKKETLKARGIRFNEPQWKHITSKANKKDDTPSGIVRDLVDADIVRADKK